MVGGAILTDALVIESAARREPLPNPAAQISDHVVPGFANSVSCISRHAACELVRQLIAHG